MLCGVGCKTVTVKVGGCGGEGVWKGDRGDL